MHEIIIVRRQWNGQDGASYRLSDITGLHWSSISGGVKAPTPRAFLHGYVSCDQMIDGHLDHSCLHGEGPHRIKVCVVKKDNNREVFRKLEELAKPKQNSR